MSNTKWLYVVGLKKKVQGGDNKTSCKLASLTQINEATLNKLITAGQKR